MPGDLPQAAGELVHYTARSGLPGNFVNAITPARQGGSWLATDFGIVRLGDGTLRTITPAQGLLERQTDAVLEDRAGTVWIGHESRGLERLTDFGFRSYGPEDGLRCDRIASLFEDQDGSLFVRTAQCLLRFDGERFADLTPPRLAASASPGWGSGSFFLRDRAGAYWLPTGEGLWRFPAGAAPAGGPEILRAGTGLTGDDVLRLWEDRAGDLWVSVGPKPGVLRLRREGGRTRAVEPLLDLGHGAPSAFAESADGTPWLGFYLGGLARRRGDHWETLTVADGLPPGMVEALLFDRHGRLWIATHAGGVARIDDPGAERPTFTRYDESNKLSSNAAFCLCEDARGDIFVGSASGVDRLDPATGAVRHYGIADGLPNPFVGTCLTTRDGALWLGTLHGLARLDPDRVPVARAPPIAIAAVAVRGSAIAVPSRGVRELALEPLASDQNALSVEVMSVSLERGAGVHFQHRFAGLDDAWSEPTSNAMLDFPRLAPGRYDLRLRAIGIDGVASPEPARLLFSVSPPVWRRPWFLALLVAALAAASWAFHRQRLHRLLAIERTRTRIASDLHDDLGSGLSQIALLAEVGQAGAEREPAQAAHLLRDVAAGCRALLDALSDIVWSIDPSRDDFGSLLARLRRFAHDGGRAAGIAVRVEAAPAVAALDLAAERRRELYLLLKEAVHNAFRHGRPQSVVVRLELRGDRLEVVVEDDGAGFEPALAREAGGRGLANMEARAQRLGGRLEIRSGAGAGTRVELEMPLVAPRGSAAAADAGRRP